MVAEKVIDSDNLDGSGTLTSHSDVLFIPASFCKLCDRFTCDHPTLIYWYTNPHLLRILTSYPKQSGSRGSQIKISQGLQYYAITGFDMIGKKEFQTRHRENAKWG